MSIFISIASYQDPLLVSTIFSAYNNAQNKDKLIFSVCDQSDSGIKVEEIEFRNQIHYEHIDPLFSKGPCWARHRAQVFLMMKTSSYKLTLTLNLPKTGILSS